MEFLSSNLVNTTTQISVTSNTALSSNLFTRDKYLQYYTDGQNSDTTTSALTITITFDVTTSVSRISLNDFNFKNFSFYYNGATANSFSILNADTNTSSYSGNTDENKYFRFNTVQCSSITFYASETILANQEKRLGLLTISDLTLELEKIPSAKSYKPTIVPKQIVHTLSDGGTRIHTVRNKWDISFNLEYVTESQRDALYDIHESSDAFTFCPFGTATGWDGFIFEAVWPGQFQFYSFSDNATVSGFSGKIQLKETPT